jgi:hypothetical protein
MLPCHIASDHAGTWGLLPNTTSEGVGTCTLDRVLLGTVQESLK